MTPSATKKNKAARGHAAAARPLSETELEPALGFLARRPVHTVIMAGWLREHGAVHPQHRGTFYRTLDADGSISGVALIGRHTCFEVASSAALKSFARKARETIDVKMVFGEAERMLEFWQYYGPRDPRFGHESDVLLFESRHAPANVAADFDIRPAERAELDQIVSAHAQMIIDETGTDPMSNDADGFRSRCARRVDEGRVWVLVRDGQLIFKTDIVSETPEAVYIEGLWINPEHRGRRLGTACMRGFCRRVLNGSNAVCGFVGADNAAAQSLYSRSGFKFQEKYSKYYA